MRIGDIRGIPVRPDGLEEAAAEDVVGPMCVPRASRAEKGASEALRPGQHLGAC